MLKEKFKIEYIPAVVWGSQSDKVVIAIHGRLSNKEGVPIQMLAKKAVSNGYQVISFDLAEHGERKEEGIPCKLDICMKDLTLVMQYVKNRWKEYNLFANSMGAYFALLTYQNEPIKNAWFLSPVVDMLEVIHNMMKWFQVSEEQLKKEQTVDTPIGQKLYWDYYSYVKEHPITHWPIKTYVLYGDKDDMDSQNTMEQFSEHFQCDLSVLKNCEHYFHTEEQLTALDQWLDRTWHMNL